jgi:ribosomal protein L11 methyltransferase
MNYYRLNFTIVPNTEINRDVLTALLAGIGFESFVESATGVEAFVPEKLYSEEAVTEILASFPLPDISIQYLVEWIEDHNWNEEWEKHFFQPIIIDEYVVIRSSFHKHIPKLPYDIVINPKMAFGTGHHATTALMISYLLELDVKDKSFLDMGCGTAILAILASKKGADPVTAIDNDEWAYENAMENVRLNNTSAVKVILGDANRLGKNCYDIVFANINRNILLNDICRYVQCMLPEASIFMSGFYTEDKKVIVEACKKHALNLISSKEKDNWAALYFKKSKE